MFIKEISGKELEKNKEKYQVIDVRSKLEYILGHIDGSTNIPYDEVLDHIDELDKNRDIALYCRTTNRSEHAAMALMAAGFDRVHVAPGVSLYDYKLVR